MSLLCVFGRHRRSLNSIVARGDRCTSLCENCGLPLVRDGQGKWKAAEPLA
jgi:hypothetical protein